MLRPYQRQLCDEIYAAWNAGHRNVLAVAPTGAGKTVCMGEVIRAIRAPTCAIAHRAELVSQISYALARERIPHRIIGPDTLRRQCQALHVLRLGQHWVEPNAMVGVAGIDTLVNRDAAADPWFAAVAYWVGDEAHHFLPENKWGRGIAMFPNPAIRGLGFTATPQRADGKALRGLFQHMVEGPTPRQLIDDGYLTDYRIFAPPSDVDYSEVDVSSTGDYSLPKLRAAVHKSSQFVGDIVTNYKRIAPGKLAAAFCVDIDSAVEVAQAFRAAGVPAEVLSGKTDPTNRVRLLREFEARQILVLVTVDVISEGFDLPALEVVIMARKTESLATYMQQFGRSLRIMVPDDLMRRWDTFTPEQRRAYIAASGKPSAIVIDHVQNSHHPRGLPDSPRVWSLDGRAKRDSGPSDAIPVRTCLNLKPLPCLVVYPRTLHACPACGMVPEITNRSAPEFVDGDLYELSPDVLAALRGQVVDPHKAPPSWPGAPQGAINKNHQERIIAQLALRKAISLWSGWQLHQGRDEREQMKRFYFSFGLDMMSAQALGRPEATALRERIETLLTSNHVQEKAI